MQRVCICVLFVLLGASTQVCGMWPGVLAHRVCSLCAVCGSTAMARQTPPHPQLISHSGAANLVAGLCVFMVFWVLILPASWKSGWEGALQKDLHYATWV
jgi:hypothetical protein